MAQVSAIDDTFAGRLGLRALAEENLCLVHLKPDLAFDIVYNAPSGWPPGTFDTPDFGGFSSTAGSILREALLALGSEGTSICTEFEMLEDGGTRLYRARFRADDQPGAATIVITDITERRERERAFDVLQREVSHRSKNLLAIIQSIAMQTAQHSDGVEDYLTRFRGRLHALSSTQDLVTDNQWHGAGFLELVAAQLSNVGLRREREIRVSGTDVELGPNAALHVGLAIHELASNFARHTTHELSTTPPVTLTGFHRDHPVFGDTFEITWQERWDPSRTRNPARFGTLMLERVVPISVSGSARYGLEDDTLIYSLNIPAAQIRT
jgi:two-component sensor histidine kinase